MTKKTNLLAMAVFAAAAFVAAPSANATPAAGMMAGIAAPVSGAIGAADTGVQLAGGRRHRGHRHGHRRWRHGHFGHVYLGYVPRYGGGCRWLKRKWRRTGSRYWRKRYYRCVNRYY